MYTRKTAREGGGGERGGGEERGRRRARNFGQFVYLCVWVCMDSGESSCIHARWSFAETSSRPKEKALFDDCVYFFGQRRRRRLLLLLPAALALYDIMRYISAGLRISSGSLALA